MKRFLLQRMKDETGISGVGIIAEGVQFSDGRCVLIWLAKLSSLVIYDSIDLVEEIHGHNGGTVVLWVDKMKIKEKSMTVNYEITPEAGV